MAAPLHRTTLRPCAAPTQPHAAPLRGPTLLRPCAAPRCYAPARPHAAPLRGPTLRPWRWSRSPQRGPHRARRRPCTRAPRSLTCAARVPPGRPPTPWSGALRSAANHRPVRPRRPAAATGPAPAWRRLRLGRPPLPRRPAQASAPRPRFQLAAGPAARSGARIGRADALAHAPPAARPARRACPRRARRPHGVGLSRPPPTTGRSARAAPRPPRAPHPHGAASASAARRCPRARPRPRPPGHASRLPLVRGPQWGPHRARRRSCTRAPRGKACAARVPPARPPTLWSGALRSAADHRPVRPRRPAAAKGPAPAWRRLRLGRPPLPTRPAQAWAPRPRFQLAAGPAARSGARIGRADALAHAPPAARPARGACPRRARRPNGVGLSGPPPAAGRSAHTTPRPPRAPHPHGAASASAARRYPRARLRPEPPRRPSRAASRTRDTGTGTRG